MAKKRTGHNTQPAYKVEERWRKNKRIKLERHLKKFPNDLQAKRALDNIGDFTVRSKPYRKNGWDRGDSKSPTWGDKLYAHQMRLIRNALRVK